MCFVRRVVVLVCASFLACLPAAASNLVTGNGFGFAVVSPSTATVTKFYAHPYSFARPDPQNPLSEGIETANFIKSLGWSDGTAHGASAEYENDSSVIHVRCSAGEGLFFMPFGLRRTALIVSWNPGSAGASRDGLHVEWNRPLSSQKLVRMYGTEMHLLKFDGIEESLLLIPLGPARPGTAQNQQPLATSKAWALISIESDSELDATIREFNHWRAGLAPQALAQREIAEFERWRVKPPVLFTGDKERHLWRQSEVLLRMAQCREPDHPGRYGNGLIVASLPDGAWFMPWVRDMAYAAVALARMGHRDEARAALLAYFNARPTGKMRPETGGANYQISVVRYFGDGAEEPFFTNEGNTNIEFDNWGLALWVLGEYMQRYNDDALLGASTYRGRLYESARDYVVRPLLANTEKYDQGLIVDADTSIWEEHQKDKKHFAFSTAMAIVGLRDFAEIAGREGDKSTQADLLKKVVLLQKGLDAAFVRDGKLHGTLEPGVKNDIDGAVLPIINFGIVTDPSIVHDTIERMELLKVSSGGYRRVRSTYTDPSIYEYWYERQEFLFVDFSLAEVYRRLGRNAEAAAILKRIVDKSAADHNVIPEMYVSLPCKLFPGKIGDPTGAMPMVGYGAGVYILDLLQRAELERQS
ncbi:MAG: glycoside hydrolase family 15 protein [Acidobacteriaceae bacterium]